MELIMVDEHCYNSELVTGYQVSNDADSLYIFNYSTDDFEVEHIDEKKAQHISSILNTYQNSDHHLYKSLDKDIHIKGKIAYISSKDFIIQTAGSIIFEAGGALINNGTGSIILKSGIEGKECEANNKCPLISFQGEQPQVILGNKDANNFVKLFYNPEKDQEPHRYQNPNNFDIYVSPSNKAISYMLVNTIYDLQMINLFLSGNYALSTNIDASVTKEWDSGRGFLPLGRENHPFSGNFDGNGYNISALHINRPEQDNVGLFGFTSGGVFNFNKITDTRINSYNITGHDNVGLLIGTASFTEISGINYDDRSILQGIKFTDSIVGKGPVSKKSQIC
jgi:hypothetical protein